MALLREHGFQGFISCEFDGDSSVSHFTGFLSSIAAMKAAIERSEQE